MATLGALLVLATTAQAQDTIKIGLIMPYSGQFADTAVQMDNGIKLYVQRYGATVAGKKIEFIRKDTGGVAPDVAKRLAQELVVRDGVDILAGFVLTPNALAAADVSASAKKLMVIMNAGTSIITTKSPYAVRTSVTLPQVSEAFGQWAAKNSVKKVYTMVSDFGPGHDAEQGFQRAFKEAGGEIIGSVRFPVANPDFSAFVQRAKDLNPEAIFLFVPAGAQPAAFAKALAERGLDAKKVKVLGTGEVTAEAALKGMGDASLGILTAWNYDPQHDTGSNKAFVKDYVSAFGRTPDFMSAGGYDGMHLIYEALKKTGGKTDGDALITATKGMAWESPRGPIAIDPETRDVVQNIYIRRVEKIEGVPVNVIIDTIKDMKDPVLARMRK
ncbi:ABC transporter substrate-binding protein [Pseudorhodoplanes sinuspersici]|nr:ABC transporter substrate-binding protein [Pseudorhodoplanes sinuspersici]